MGDVRKNKKSKGRQCVFCGLIIGHYVNHYPKRDDHKKNEHCASFSEYNMNSAESRIQLVYEIEKNMVVTQQYETCPVGLYG